jgi:hypothetical protein
VIPSTLERYIASLPIEHQKAALEAIRDYTPPAEPTLIGETMMALACDLDKQMLKLAGGETDTAPRHLLSGCVSAVCTIDKGYK